MFESKITFECNNMRKGNIVPKIMVYLIALFIFISISLIPVIADPVDNKGDGNGDINTPPSSPPKGPNNESDGNSYNNSEQNKDQNTDNKNDTQNREQNQNQENNSEQNQKQNQNRTGENDNVTEKKMRYQQRNMEMVLEQNRTKIRSEWEQDEYQDELEIIFDTEKGPRFILDYKNNMHSFDNNLSFKIQIKELIEYRDINGNSRYDQEDIIVNVYSFENLNFENLTYQNKYSDDGKKINLISTQTENGVFKINIYHSNNYSVLGNQILSPSEIKIDFIINNYPFEEQNTQLALNAMLETQHRAELNINSFDEIQGFSDNESVLDITTNNNHGFFSWAEKVDVDNVTNQVKTTIQSQIIESIVDNVKISNKISNIYFSYPRGSNIIHDPKIGVISISFDTFELGSIGNLINIENIFTYVGICILASFMFLGLIFIRKKI